MLRPRSLLVVLLATLSLSVVAAAPATLTVGQWLDKAEGPGDARAVSRLRSTLALAARRHAAALAAGPAMRMVEAVVMVVEERCCGIMPIAVICGGE